MSGPRSNGSMRRGYLDEDVMEESSSGTCAVENKTFPAVDKDERRTPEEFRREFDADRGSDNIVVVVIVSFE